MNKSTRAFLDRIQLPIVIIIFLSFKREKKAIAKEIMENWRCEERKKSIPFKISKYFLK